MDDQKKYTSSLIPSRKSAQSSNRLPSEQISLADTVLSDNAGFAEIEYETPSSQVKAAGGQFFSAPAQAIDRRASDPIREKFYAMRHLATDNPFARNDAGLFYKQAKFVEDFTDDYSEYESFSMYYPYYQHMGYKQLRTYFTWRSKVRSCHYPKTSLSYVFLYIYELLSGVGAQNPAEGLDKLVALWTAYGEQYPAINKYLPGWFKDYHIYYTLPQSFADFVNAYNLQKYYPELFLFEFDIQHSLDLWNNISNYKIIKSKFYNDGNELLLKECFYAVLNGIKTFCFTRNTRIEDLFIYEISKGVFWDPFRQALFHPWLNQPNHQVTMPNAEIYYCYNNLWTADIPIHHSGRAALAGYIIKKTEACLRQVVKYKFKITADHGDVNRSFQKLRSLGITLVELDKVIEDAATNFHLETTRTIVTVNRDNLTRIRKEAMGTQDMLIVPEGSAANLPSPVLNSDKPDELVHESIPAPTPLPKPDAPDLPEPQTASDGWANDWADGWIGLGSALTTAEREALHLLSQSDSDGIIAGTDIKALADKNGIMLEVLADSINEKAVDHIGDNILEMDETMVIYEEYREKIMEMVRSV